MHTLAEVKLIHRGKPRQPLATNCDDVVNSGFARPFSELRISMLVGADSLVNMRHRASRATRARVTGTSLTLPK